MKDEEMAEEYLNEKCKDCYMCSYSEHKNPYKICQRRKDRKQAFLAGLKVGRPQWHTDPNDLPPMIQDERYISERVWINVENWGTEDGYYDYNKNCWIIRCRIVNLPILGWCEIPTFDKE